MAPRLLDTLSIPAIPITSFASGGLSMPCGNPKLENYAIPFDSDHIDFGHNRHSALPRPPTFKHDILAPSRSENAWLQPVARHNRHAAITTRVQPLSRWQLAGVWRAQ